MTTMSETARPYQPTALPPVVARFLAFLAILVGGLCGGLIGWAVTDLQCGGEERTVVVDREAPNRIAVQEGEPAGDDDGCTTWNGVGALLGAGVGAGGTAVVAVLVLRAMAEWRRDLDVEEPPDAT